MVSSVRNLVLKEMLSLTAEPGFSNVAAGSGVKTCPPCRDRTGCLKIRDTHLHHTGVNDRYNTHN